jgi:alkylation response protein AidB-like acyl-CoA dehydrogenase
VDFSIDAEALALRQRILLFSRDQLNEDVLARDREHRFDRACWDKLAGFGLAGLSVPVELGGLGLDVSTTAVAVEALGEGCTDLGLVFSACAHLFACVMPVVEHGSEDLRQRFVPKLASGEWIGANAITEGEAGSDVFALKTRAVRDGDSYVLDGAKSYVTNGPVADAFLVYASTAPEDGFLGLSAFLVPRDTPGLVLGQPFQKMGLRTSPICSIYLERCQVPAELMVGEEGGGGNVFTRSMHWERVCLFAAYVGAMQRQLEQVVAQATQRKQFRKPIARFQAVSHRIVDMKLRLDAARLLLYRACWLRDRGETAALEISLAKIAISEAAVQSGLDAIATFGGIGVVDETGMERMLRDAIPATIFSGTSDMQREIAARELGL